jgi:hypothetical protein
MDEPLPENAAPGKTLTPQARRALEEAAARRRARVAAALIAEVQATGAGASRELNGPAGPEPTRFGDWERKGVAVDF